MIRNAKPVWVSCTGVNQYIDAKHVFEVRNVSAAKLQICADTDYALFLNGEFVGCGQYRTFLNVKAYDEYDVERFLKAGENLLEITVFYEGKDTQTYIVNDPMLMYAVKAGEKYIYSGEETQVRPNPRYHSGEIEWITPQLGSAYCYDASKEETKWQSPEISPKQYMFMKRPVHKLIHKPLEEGSIYTQGLLERNAEGNTAEQMQTDGLFFRMPDVIFRENENCRICVKKQEGGAYFVLDLGKEYAGLFTMELTAAAGTVVDMAWGEHLEDMRVRANIYGRHFAGRYICREGHQEFTTFFRRIAGRYLQIHITDMKEDVCFLQLGMIPTDYPLDREGYFNCNDYLFRRIVEVSADTLKLCMHEHYEDCPWREQALYGFDSYIQMLCGYYLFGEYEFAKASLKLLADSQRKDGLLAICGPCGATLTIPSFSLSWIISVEKYVLYSGDIGFGREMIPVAEGILKSFVREEHLVKLELFKEYWHFYEWSDGLDENGPFRNTDEADAKNYVQDAPSNILFIMAYQAYEKICSYAGEKADLVIDTEMMKQAVVKKFYDAEEGLFRTKEGERRFHEYTQAIAYISGVTDDDRILKRLIRKDNGLITNTLSTSIFKYEALLSKGDKYLDAVTDEVAEIWGKMLYQGAVTFYEVAEGASAFMNAGSLCHGWAAVPVYLLYKYYLGLEPLTPGYGEYRLEPRKTRNITEMETVMYLGKEARKICVKDGCISEK